MIIAHFSKNATNYLRLINLLTVYPPSAKRASLIYNQPGGPPKVAPAPAHPLFFCCFFHDCRLQSRSRSRILSRPPAQDMACGPVRHRLRRIQRSRARPVEPPRTNAHPADHPAARPQSTRRRNHLERIRTSSPRPLSSRPKRSGGTCTSYALCARLSAQAFPPLARIPSIPPAISKSFSVSPPASCDVSARRTLL